MESVIVELTQPRPMDSEPSVVNLAQYFKKSLLSRGAHSLSLRLAKHCSTCKSTSYPIFLLQPAPLKCVLAWMWHPMPASRASTGSNVLNTGNARHCVQNCSRQVPQNLPGERTVAPLQIFQPYNTLVGARSDLPQSVMYLFCQLCAKSHSYNVICTKQVHACKMLRG